MAKKSKQGKLKVDLEEFNKLVDRYSKMLANSSMKAKLAVRGLQSVREAKRRIDQSRDVRENPFAPIKENRRPLFKTQNLYNAFGFKSSGTELQILNSASYFSFHNLGTKFIKQRQTLDPTVEQDTLLKFIQKELDSIK